MTITDEGLDLTEYLLTDESPLKRVRRSLNITQVALADKAHVSRMVVIRAEQGLYSTIPDRLLVELSKVAGYAIPRRDIQPLYEAWQRDQRMLQEWVNDPFVGRERTKFRDWRISVTPIKSAMGFCRLLCIHPNALRGLENGTSQSFPSQISAALQHAGISEDRLEYLYSLTPNGLSEYASGRS